MIRHFARWLVALCLLIAGVSAYATTPDATTTVSVEAANAPTRDVELYRDIVSRMEQGESYYEAATKLHRARDYPLRPFFTVRSPALAWLTWALGRPVLYTLLIVMATMSLLVWLWRDPTSPLYERLLVAAILGVSGAAMIGPAQISMHETWCGILLTLALGLHLRGHWWTALAAASAALAFREFAILFLGLMGAIALWEREWRRAAACVGVAVLFAIFMSLHAQAVMTLVEPGDLSSPGWQAARGPAGFLDDLRQLSFLQYVPNWLGAGLAIGAFAGWAVIAKASWTNAFAIIWFAGFALFISLFARANNFYWVEVILPIFLVGLAFLPKAATDWRKRHTSS